MNKIYSVITGTGSYIPENIISGDHFMEASFFDNGIKLDKENTEIIHKFSEITEIVERRYADCDLLNSNIATIAAQRALLAAGADKESLDHIIFCHNFGDVKNGSNRMDMLPALAAKVKQELAIENPDCVAYDIIFGCQDGYKALYKPITLSGVEMPRKYWLLAQRRSQGSSIHTIEIV